MTGDFSASQLLQIKLKAEQMWNDAQAFAHLRPNADAAITVLSHQTARFKEMEDRTKDNKVKVTWVKTCDIQAQDCEPNCDLDEPEVETQGQEYEYDICKKTGFSVDEETLRTNNYNFAEVVAPSLATAIKTLDEFWAQQTLIKLKAFSGVNLAAAPFTYQAPINATVVPANLYGNPLGGYSGFQLPTIFTKQMIQNKINNAYYIDNGRMWLEYQNSMLQRGATEGMSVAGLSRAQSLDVNFDIFNFAQSGITNVSTFAVGRNAIAFKTTNRHPDTPVTIGGKVQQTLYTVPSIALPGVKYDVYYTVSCKVGQDGSTRFVHTWRVETKGGIWKNPEGCPVTIGAGNPNVPAGTHTPTGILAYLSDDEQI